MRFRGLAVRAGLVSLPLVFAGGADAVRLTTNAASDVGPAGPSRRRACCMSRSAGRLTPQTERAAGGPLGVAFWSALGRVGAGFLDTLRYAVGAAGGPPLPTRGPRGY